MAESLVDIGFRAFRRVLEFGIGSGWQIQRGDSGGCGTRNSFPGFRPQTTVRGVFGDPKARVVTLVRRSKKRSAAAAVACTRAGTIGAYGGFAIFPVATRASTWRSRSGACRAGVAVT